MKYANRLLIRDPESSAVTWMTAMLKAKTKPVKKTTMKNDIILFAAMLAVAWIGFNVVNERLVKKAAYVDGQTIESSANQKPTDSPKTSASAASTFSPASADARFGNPEQQIKSLLKNRVDAWNDRNLDRYMADYQKFDSLSVNIDGETKKDWQPVYDRFASQFGPEMGTLRISNIKIDMVGENASIVAADWNLQQSEKVTNGRMNLVLNKIDAGWKIITENLIQK